MKNENNSTISRIKSTINELKKDINLMKRVNIIIINLVQKNENVFNNLISSYDPIEHKNLENEEYETNKNNTNRNINSDLNDEKDESYKNIEYELEIQRLKKQYKTLKLRNKFLLTKLDDITKSNNLLEEELNIDILDKTGINDIINNVPFINENNNPIEKINHIYMICEDISLKEEFINDLKTLYLLKNKNNEELSIKKLWRWLKDIIENIRNINDENENFKTGLEHLKQEKDIFKNFCLDLMSQLNIKNIDGLKNYINSLIMKRNIEKKRISQLKKVLTEIKK